jgi:hypothetical protein
MCSLAKEKNIVLTLTQRLALQVCIDNLTIARQQLEAVKKEIGITYNNFTVSQNGEVKDLDNIPQKQE